MIIILRYRDLNIPLGETIVRHNRSIEDHGHVWWGWMRRQKETFPSALFASLSAECRSRASIPIYLFDSGTEQIHKAQLGGISAAPAGAPLPPPDSRCTPQYMAEAILPAWFKLTKIEESPLSEPIVQVTGLPTLPNPSAPDLDLLTHEIRDLSQLRHSGATLWEAAIDVST
jgi:hypothetical protein